MPDKKDIIIIALLCLTALGLGYWVGQPKKAIDKPITPSNNTTVKLAANNNATKPARKIAVTEEIVIGEYERKGEVNTIRGVFLGNGNFETYRNGEKSNTEYKWRINEEGEIHYSTFRDGDIGVFRINPDRSLTAIAQIKEGKRRDISRKVQLTYIKIE